MEDLEQRQRGELPRQLEAVQRRPRDFAALAFAIAGRWRRQAQQVVHPLAKARLLGVALLVGLLEQALLGRLETRGGQRIVQLGGRGVALVQLLEPLRVAQQLLGQYRHGRMEGAHALPGHAGVEGVLPEAQHLDQLLAQLRAGGIGEGNHRQALGRDAHVAEHEHHAQHQGGRLARASPGKHPGDRMAAEDHRPLLVRWRADHPGLHRLADALAHGLDLRGVDRHLRRSVDTLAGPLGRLSGPGGSRLGGLGTGSGRLLRTGRPGLPGDSDNLVRPCPGPGVTQGRFTLGAQVRGCAREIARQGRGEEQFVAFDGRQHSASPIQILLSPA
ncbi:hypothetical protein D3C80_1028130 [compost metagenome]